MDRLLRIATVAALGFASIAAAPAARADGHGGVTVGGWIEVIGGTSDNDKAGGVDGISRGFYSRIEVGYDAALDSGLEVAGRIAYQLNQRGDGVNITAGSAADGQRMDASTNYDPDVLFISVGGGFGTVTAGAAPPATCSTVPRPIGFVNGVDTTYYELFSGLEMINPTFSEHAYCDTPEQVSYATPTVGGFTLMATYAPDTQSNQGTSLKQARAATSSELGGQAHENIEDRIDVAVSWSSSIGGMSVELGAGYQQGRFQQGGADMESTILSGAVGFGPVMLGAQWHGTEEGDDKHDGYSLAASYEVGNLSLGATWSASELKDGSQEDSALVLGASYALGGGLTSWVEYYGLEADQKEGPTDDAGNKIPESDDVIIFGLTLGF